MAFKTPNSERAADWNRKNPEKHAGHVKNWEAKNPDKRREYMLTWRSKPENREKMRIANAKRSRRDRLQRQGWTDESIEAAFQRQNGLCALCSIALTRGKTRGPAGMCADHDHATGTPRGLLCHRCNVAEGLIQGTGLSPQEWLTRLQAYLDKHVASAH